MKRNPPSDAERTMWWRLRMERAGAKFRREHPIGPYRADFACLELGLVIDLDGGQHMTSADQAYDARRDAFMQTNGWTVVRVWTKWWFDNPDSVMLAIDEAITFAHLERAQAFQGACARTPLNRLRLRAGPLQSRCASQLPHKWGSGGAYTSFAAAPLGGAAPRSGGGVL